MVTEITEAKNYFWCMDPSVQYLMGSDVPEPAGATIHSIVPIVPIATTATTDTDDDKIGFTLDVSMRLDRESDEVALGGDIIAIVAEPPEDLADSA
jgi:hypothetical protein